MKITRFIDENIILDEQEEQEFNKLIKYVDKETNWTLEQSYKKDFIRCAIYLTNNLPYGILKAMDYYRHIYK